MALIASVHPLTEERFGDIEQLFAQKGCSFARGCWCMDYRITGQVKTKSGTKPTDPKAYKKRLFRAAARRTPAPGLVAYDAQGVPIGWVATGPREDYPRLQNSPVMKPVDGVAAWAIVCFVVPSQFRGKGIARQLVDHAVDHARAAGAPAIEAFPVDKRERSAPQWLWHGTPSLFAGKGFEEIARRKPDRPVLRKALA